MPAIAALAGLLVVSSTLVATPAFAVGSNYYLDCAAATNGTGTIGSPWNSVTSVNTTATRTPAQPLARATTSATPAWGDLEGLPGVPAAPPIPTHLKTETMPRLEDIRIRDPFVFFHEDDDAYYLFGTTDPHPWTGPGVGFDAYRSSDLVDWSGPIPVFRPRPGFWGTTQFWAPEIHGYRGRFYTFATFADEDGNRGTQILAADRVEGPYEVWSPLPVTPEGWKCLDGTFLITGDGQPWVVFCHEWVQAGDGAIYASRLTDDLTAAVGPPLLLFHASDAPWPRPTPDSAGTDLHPALVTDGPFFLSARDGSLALLWSSAGDQGYATGLATSASGLLEGPWVHQPEPVWAHDGGHAMTFRTREGVLLLSLHQPNDYPNERAVFTTVEDTGGSLRLRPELT